MLHHCKLLNLDIILNDKPHLACVDITTKMHLANIYLPYFNWFSSSTSAVTCRNDHEKCEKGRMCLEDLKNKTNSQNVSSQESGNSEPTRLPKEMELLYPCTKKIQYPIVSKKMLRMTRTVHYTELK